MYGTQQIFDAALAIIKTKISPKTKLDIELKTDEMITVIIQIETNFIRSSAHILFIVYILLRFFLSVSNAH